MRLVLLLLALLAWTSLGVKSRADRLDVVIAATDKAGPGFGGGCRLWDRDQRACPPAKPREKATQMSGMTRTFVAVDLPQEVKDQLGRLRARLEPEAPGVRWVKPEQCHVTLAFLGDVADVKLGTLSDVVSAAAARFGPFELVLQGLGAFPNPARPRVLWAGLEGPGVGSLRALHRAVLRALKSGGFPPEDDRFTPHVTIGRIKAGHGTVPDLTRIVAEHQSWMAGTFAVAEVVTFASELSPAGPSYTALARSPLTGGTGVSPA